MTNEYIADEQELARLRTNRNIGRFFLGIFFLGFFLMVVQPHVYHNKGVEDGVAYNTYGIVSDQIGRIGVNAETEWFYYGWGF